MNLTKLLFAVLNHVDEIEAVYQGAKGKSVEKRAAAVQAVMTSMGVARDAGHPLPVALPVVAGQMIDAVIAAKNLVQPHGTPAPQ